MVYVICPAYYKTGGTELLHQLVCHLNHINVDAIIAYSDCDAYEGRINPAFIEYINSYIEIKDIEDQSQNTVVVSEIACKYLKYFKRVRKVIWWLSVDNFIRECGLIGRIRISGLRRGVLGTVKRIVRKKYENISKYIWIADLHLCQSYYALDYLQSIGMDKNKVEYLSDYLNDQYLDIVMEDGKKRDDVILYNPQKGYKFTKKIIKSNPQYTWVALKNMNNAQVIEAMKSAKIYIDFGNHPGKDRMPREAAMAGCCIVTGRRGAASNDKDINILKKYKFDDKRDSVDKISNCIYNIMMNFSECNEEFNRYRTGIRNEKEQFIDDVSRIFG